MSYANLTHLTARYSQRDLRMMTDPNGQSIVESVVTQALTDASDEVDSYLGQRYVLPLRIDPNFISMEVFDVTTHPVLSRLTCDIAVYRMQTLRQSDDVKDARHRYEDALKMLAKFANGHLTLLGRQVRHDVSESTESSASAGMPEFTVTPSLFGRSAR